MKFIAMILAFAATNAFAVQTEIFKFSVAVSYMKCTDSDDGLVTVCEGDELQPEAVTIQLNCMTHDDVTSCGGGWRGTVQVEELKIKGFIDVIKSGEGSQGTYSLVAATAAEGKRDLSDLWIDLAGTSVNDTLIYRGTRIPSAHPKISYVPEVIIAPVGAAKLPPRLMKWPRRASLN